MNRTVLLYFTICAGVLGLCYVSTNSVHAQAQAVSEPKLHLADMFTTSGRAMLIGADSIERDESTMRLRGNVEITLRPLSPSDEMMVLRADEADYDRKSDQIIPRGRVRVTFEKPR